jgi:hypothetical protein
VLWHKAANFLGILSSLGESVNKMGVPGKFGKHEVSMKDQSKKLIIIRDMESNPTF